mmetsp:Transcript_20119/g.29859  ORF Transcript_20119/g.29859 Transcript_20119/m.29859 type:complete len:219 (+) Transcript_20119:93-749(+)
MVMNTMMTSSAPRTTRIVAAPRTRASLLKSEPRSARTSSAAESSIALSTVKVGMVMTTMTRKMLSFGMVMITKMRTPMIGLVTGSALQMSRMGAALSTRASLLRPKLRTARTSLVAVSSSALSTVRAQTVGTATPLKIWNGTMMVIRTILALQMNRRSVVNSMMVSLLLSSNKSVRTCGIAAFSSAPSIARPTTLTRRMMATTTRIVATTKMSAQKTT